MISMKDGCSGYFRFPMNARIQNRAHANKWKTVPRKLLNRFWPDKYAIDCVSEIYEMRANISRGIAVPDCTSKCYYNCLEFSLGIVCSFSSNDWSEALAAGIQAANDNNNNWQRLRIANIALTSAEHTRCTYWLRKPKSNCNFSECVIVLSFFFFGFGFVFHYFGKIIFIVFSISAPVVSFAF